ncbi:hypothetical protein LTR56_016918 [Elasticomyces elasticus]|nr:hypothetical protein LTR56_016918 [Elasticomyces elasticus]KAK3640417.1 hypothetical protein LTR22_016970 [Elasticomyces elasticus]KAK4931203.1 hypothetical protein LTR49_002260 [Elasticomyces elasticus]KAK5767866.1 hypothetical protein LTS12_002019 [Elasticomyces elasticus]
MSHNFADTRMRDSPLLISAMISSLRNPGVRDLLARQKAEKGQGIDGEQNARDESVRGADVLLASAGDDDDDFSLASTADDEGDAPDEMQE